MRALKFIDKFKTAQIHAFNPTENSNPKIHGGGNRAKLNSNLFVSFGSNSKSKSNSVSNGVIPFGLPRTDLIEPTIDTHLRPVDFVESLADLSRRFENCPSESNKSLLCIEQYSLFLCLGDPKILRRCLREAHQNAVDLYSRVVLSAWLRFERREVELLDMSEVDCKRQIFECPEADLVSGYDSNSNYNNCKCRQDSSEVVNMPKFKEDERLKLEKSDVSFYIRGERVKCVRYRIASLSIPFKAMLYGGFKESRTRKIDFSANGISVEGMRAVELYSRTRKLESFSPTVVMELLSFSNRFCCEELKSACDAHLASLVVDIEDALVFIEYGLDETANLLVAVCLQFFLRGLPGSLYNQNMMKFLCSVETREKFTMLGHACFLLYYFLSQVAIEESMVADTTVMLLERLKECAVERWQKALALHQLGCVFFERKEYSNARRFFEAAAEEGHVYSLAGVARAKHKMGQQYSAYRLMNSLIFKYKPVGWMYQERSLYNIGKEKLLDLGTATELDPSLSFPYKYRAVSKIEEKQIREAILEINKIIRFKLSTDCLELRAWFFIALEDYESALRDIHVLLTLEPNYKMFCDKFSGEYMVELLNRKAQKRSQADCWMCLYERWSSVDDIGSLAIIHQMLANDPENSLLLFRQSLLLLRLNRQKAAMNSLRLARNHSKSEHERLIYEGWILYDTGNREEALSRAEKSISIQRSFEAFFLKAYALADTSLDRESSSTVIQLLEEALKCPSDGLRKGQALNNLGSIYLDYGNPDKAANCYMNALDIKHTRAHQGLARVYHLKNLRKDAYDEMTKLIGKAHYSASAYEKRSEYCEREMANNDLDMATELDPTRTYPYRYRAAVLMDDQKENEAVEELSRAIAFRADLQMLHLRAAFYDSMGYVNLALRDCQAALCIDPSHAETLELYKRVRISSINE